jgi:hypothetical protein
VLCCCGSCRSACWHDRLGCSVCWGGYGRAMSWHDGIACLVCWGALAADCELVGVLGWVLLGCVPPYFAWWVCWVPAACMQTYFSACWVVVDVLGPLQLLVLHVIDGAGCIWCSLLPLLPLLGCFSLWQRICLTCMLLICTPISHTNPATMAGGLEAIWYLHLQACQQKQDPCIMVSDHDV